MKTKFRCVCVCSSSSSSSSHSNAMACGPVDGADHGGRGWPARAGAGWGALIGEAAVNPERPRAASASVTPNIFGAATRPASRVTVMHNMLGNWDVDNDPAVS